ncbi:hypothetical protein S7711_08153 [Stachybotrys chartarum IBT 7711]|uniref:Zn(2)-C6 fungal-type domain-containing protein n=1 Tax=Stachybotrys chartarum (strain CBS 109288 / IBT 7711) TaxID=1280523 RepID=A0A084AIF4_STACB|nr:hypothetical protein S7711_08153 [Stachybotrys chartarum IBT 7711]
MASHSGRQSAKVLSCASCRHRKIKCDKAQPECMQCSRANMQCIFPSRKPTRRAPRPRQQDLLDRISRLETIVGQADPDKDGPGASHAARVAEARDGASVATAATGTGIGSGPLQDRAASAVDHGSSGREHVSPAAARYMSSEFWGNLCEEVEGIKQALEQSSDDEDDEFDENSPESFDAGSPFLSGPSGFILGNPGYHERDPLGHPPPDMIQRLWAIYCHNCDPILKILHRPTTQALITAVIESPTTPQPRSTNALIFSIYFAAVSSLSHATCRSQLGQSHDFLVNKYRICAERALASADFLSANDLATLQAFAIYVGTLRTQTHNRASWSLLALLSRLAQAMDLHRDGDGGRFPPFEAEMRRRLWHFILVLDIRGAEDRGTDASISSESYNTLPPTSIDDADMSPTMTGPLVPKDGPADNVLQICMSRCSTVFGYLLHQPFKVTSEPERYIYTEDKLVEEVRYMETHFIQTARQDHMPSLLAADITRLVIIKLWLVIQYPFSPQLVISRPRVSHHTMLRTALSILELSERLAAPRWTDRFSWWTETYVQWHPLAVTLAELCMQPESELADKAWDVVGRAYPRWKERIADTSRGSLWRPIRKLMKKATAAREAARLSRLSLNEGALATEPMELAPAAEPVPVTQPAQPTDAAHQLWADNQLLVDPALPCEVEGMDLTNLFEYPPELLVMDTEQPYQSHELMEMSAWTEFLNDAIMDNSPDGMGRESS